MERSIEEESQWSYGRSNAPTDFSSSLFARMEAKQARLRAIPPLIDAKGRARFPLTSKGVSSGEAVSYESSLFAKLIPAQEKAWISDKKVRVSSA
jgi:hypothetical protein